VGYQVIKQPDGRLAIWSSYTDSWAAADCTADEVVAIFTDKAEADAKRDAERIVTHVLAGDARAVYSQFAMTFEEADEDARPGEKYADLPTVPEEPAPERPKVYLVNDHDCGGCGRIVGVFDSQEKAEALITRYRDAYESDEPWPDDLIIGTDVHGLAVEPREVA
jgi:hypothetical protein